MPLVVEGHPQVQKVLDGLLAGVPYHKIGQSVTPPLTAMAIMRYKKRFLEPTLKGAGELVRSLQSIANGERPEKELDPVAVTRAALAADPYLSRIARHHETIDNSLAAATKKKDGKAVAALVGVDLKGLELDARLTGRLETSAGSVTNHFYCLAQPLSLDTGPIVDVQAEPADEKP